MNYPFAYNKFKLPLIKKTKATAITFRYLSMHKSSCTCSCTHHSDDLNK